MLKSHIQDYTGPGSQFQIRCHESAINNLKSSPRIYTSIFYNAFEKFHPTLFRTIFSLSFQCEVKQLLISDNVHFWLPCCYEISDELTSDPGHLRNWTGSRISTKVGVWSYKYRPKRVWPPFTCLWLGPHSFLLVKCVWRRLETDDL